MAYQQKLAVRESHKAENIYRELAENIREVLIINSPDKNKTINVNPAYEEFCGMSCASLYEKPRSHPK